MCEVGYKVTEYGSCTLTDIKGCIIEEYNNCTLCKTNMVITEGKCNTTEGMTLSNGVSTSIICNSGYYNENGICNECTKKYGKDCEECDINTCLNCVDGEHIFNTTSNGTCQVIEDCVNDGKANDSNGLCSENVDDCIHYMNGRCMSAKKEYLMK